jgi:uncharacterized lipoprotein YmbA
MRKRLVLLLIGAATLAACAGEPPARTMQLRSCDDGGSGGVIIDGVCL